MCSTTVFLHIGQCGIQVGSEFWANMMGTTKHEYFPSLTLSSGQLSSIPCVLYDTEAKPVQSFTSLVKTRIHPLNVITGRKGCGGNWGCGYSEVTVEEPLLEQVRKTAESCDCFMGVVIFHSLAGGTGSGATSNLIERLRSIYSSHYIVNIAIAPFATGESPMQYYNTLLTTHHLQEYSDCVIMIQNDEILRQRGVLNTDDMNKVISQSLLNCLKPLRARSVYTEPFELVRSLCPQSSCKFIKTSPDFNSWEIKEPMPSRKPRATHTVLCVLRGSQSGIGQIMTNTKTLEKKLKSLHRLVDWNPFPIDYWFSSESTNKHMSILANGSDITDYLRLVRNRAALMYHQRAFLHWYTKYGVETDMFKSSFENIQKIIDNYCNTHQY